MAASTPCSINSSPRQYSTPNLPVLAPAKLDKPQAPPEPPAVGCHSGAVAAAFHLLIASATSPIQPPPIQSPPQAPIVRPPPQVPIVQPPPQATRVQSPTSGSSSPATTASSSPCLRLQPYPHSPAQPRSQASIQQPPPGRSQYMSTKGPTF
jgi:hypothetical protein